jgi:hypothetical protein
MSREGHEVFSEVTGGRPVFTSAAVGGVVPQERGTGTGRLTPHAAALVVTPPQAEERRNHSKDFITRAYLKWELFHALRSNFER